MVLKKFRWRNWVLWQLMLILFKDDTIMNVVLNVFFIETNNLNVFWPQCKDFNLKNQKTNWKCEGTTSNYISLLRYFYLHKWVTPLMKPGFRYLVSLRYSALSFWTQPEMEFKEFESRFKSAKIRQNPV